MIRSVFLGFLFASSLAVFFGACSGSDPSSELVDGRFDVAALSADVFRLCESAQCTDYSESECKFFLRYDILEYAYLSESPDACFTAFHREMACLADAADCYEESCYAADDACTFSDEVPEVEVPEAVQQAQGACEFRADCEASFSGGTIGRERLIADCQVEYIVRTAIFEHDRGEGCARAFIDFLECFANAEGVSCDASAEEEEAACPSEVARFDALCFDDD